jgi:hypothetical protein
MTESELSQNLLSTYIYLSAAKEHLFLLKQFEKRIKNDQFKDITKQLAPKVNYFIRTIESTLLDAATFKPSHLEQIENLKFEIMESLDRELKTIL